MRLQEPVENGNERAIHRHKCQISSSRSPSSILIYLLPSSLSHIQPIKVTWKTQHSTERSVNETAMITLTKPVSVPRTLVKHRVI